MAKGFKHGAGAGGGGADLNFDVKAYATEVLLLAATPKENTIGVVTGTPIAGYIFSATQPDTITEGVVWFLTGATSTVEFNALKKNNITVYPISAEQYISGEWVDKTAKIYQGSVWVDWLTYLFKEGEGEKVQLATTGSTINIGTDGITFSGSSSKGLYADVAVALEKTSTFCVEATITSVGTSADYTGSLVAKTPDKYTSSRNDHPTTATARTKLTADGVRTVYKMSLSAGTWNLGISGNVVGTVHNMWYE